MVAGSGLGLDWIEDADRLFGKAVQEMCWVKKPLPVWLMRVIQLLHYLPVTHTIPFHVLCSPKLCQCVYDRCSVDVECKKFSTTRA